MSKENLRKKAAQDLILDPEKHQKDSLEKAKYMVQTQHYYMVEYLKKDDMEGALNRATLMLNELRTGILTPKNYYNLYMLTFDKLRDLLVFFREKMKEGEDMSEIYERVQYTSLIVPRVYLLITAGVAYIESKQVRAQNILKDMVEICKGVQHPTRGLFLRHHLSTMTKNLIPDIDTDYGGTITESINYILVNFRETVNLYGRLKTVREDETELEKREEERKSLRTLLGSNLVRMAQLEGCNEQIYRLRVLPAILEICVKYKDAMAQQFVMESIIQVFPDEFHLKTIESLLGVTEKLEEGIYLTPIFTSLLNRLANFAQRYPEHLPEDKNELINMFSKFINPASEKMSLGDLLTVKTSMLKLILEVCPENTESVSETLLHLSEQLTDSFDPEDDKMTKLVADLIYQPVARYHSIETIVTLKGLKEIFALLKYTHRKKLSIALCNTAIRVNMKISSLKTMLLFMQFLAPLLRDEKDYVPPKKESLFERDQCLVARICHLFDHEDTDELFKIYSTIRKIFGKGGEKRIKYTLAPLVFEYLKLAERIYYEEREKNQDPYQDDGLGGGLGLVSRPDEDKEGKGEGEGEDKPEEKKERKFHVAKVLQYVIEILKVLAKKFPLEAFNLYLQCAICADTCEMEQYVYEYLTQAFLLYEERESKQQTSLLYVIMNSLVSLKNISPENYETLAIKTVHYANKLLMKPQQCLSTVLCSFLFWPCNHNKNGINTDKALECLQYSFKIVKMCMHKDQMPLFVEILNAYFTHLASDNEKVTTEHVQELIEFINKNIGSYEEEEIEIKNKDDAVDPDESTLKKYFANIKEYINLKKRKDPMGLEKLSVE